MILNYISNSQTTTKKVRIQKLWRTISLLFRTDDSFSKLHHYYFFKVLQISSVSQLPLFNLLYHRIKVQIKILTFQLQVAAKETHRDTIWRSKCGNLCSVPRCVHKWCCHNTFYADLSLYLLYVIYIVNPMILRIKRPFCSPYTAMPCLSFDTKKPHLWEKVLQV